MTTSKLAYQLGFNRIFLVRMLLTAYYNYRISNVTSRLHDLHKERESTIEKLKTATKYDSTQQLLEKYGSTPHTIPQTSSPSVDKQSPGPRRLGEKPEFQGQRRLPLVPPATANIPRNPPIPQREALDINLPGKGSIPQYQESPPTAIRSKHASLEPGPPEFAPNAFPTPSQTTTGHLDEPKWYDRILDLLLGEDETLPRNRLALVCTHCRLVNGQAPPGIKRLEELGKWRCGGCQGWNGVEDEAKKIIAEAQNQAKSYISENRALEHAGSKGPEGAHTEADDAVLVSVKDENTSKEQGDLQKGDGTEQNDESDDKPKPSPSPKPKGRPKGSGRKKS
jgi:endoplasmic reticulum junction formation protein lunapark